MSHRAQSTKENAATSLYIGFQQLYNIKEVQAVIPEDHVYATPERSKEAIFELFSGCWEEPRVHLDKTFSNVGYDELLFVNEIPFVSMCAHHTLPFMGKVYFSYVPDKKLVGLSKIPRFVESLAHRPQIQEQLTAQIVDTFMEEVKPFGCGVVIEAWHLCMMIRGAETSGYTKTTALRGSYSENTLTRNEFLMGIRKSSERIWP